MLQVLGAKDRLEWRFPCLFSQEKQTYDSKRMSISPHEQNTKDTKQKTISRREVSEVSGYNTKNLLKLALNERFFLNFLRVLYFWKEFPHTKQVCLVNYMYFYLSPEKDNQASSKTGSTHKCQQIVDLKFKERRNRLEDSC